MNNNSKRRGYKMELQEEILIQEQEKAPKEEKEENTQNLGKFKSVEALLTAYTSLEAEFTRRSQKLKELENKVEDLQQATAEKASTPNVDLQNRATVQTALDLESIEGLPKELKAAVTDIVQECLQSHLQQAAPPILKEVGGFAKAPQQTATSIEEAGKLAEAFFKNIK